MKTNVPALAFLAAILPCCAMAQSHAIPALGDSAVSGHAAVAEVGGRSDTAAAPAATGCYAFGPQAQVGRGVFKNDYEISAGGQAIGTVTSQGSGYALMSGGGAIAKATIKETANGRTATITGCGGATIGVIEELDTDSQSAFNIKDAAGKPIMTTGWVSGGDMSASAAAGSMKVADIGGLFKGGDKYDVTIYGAPTQVGIFTAVMNNAAAYRRSSERRRERMMDGPHGRADR